MLGEPKLHTWSENSSLHHAGFVVYFAFCCGRLVETLDFGGVGREAPW